MDEDLAEIARGRALRLMAETLLAAARDRDLPQGTRERLGDAASDLLLELRARPIGAERHLQLQQLLAEVTVTELGEPFD